VTDPTQLRRVETIMTPAEGVSGLVDGYLCGVTATLPSERAVLDALVVAAPATPPDKLAEQYRLCAAALAVARTRGLRGIRPLTELAVGVALDAHPRLGGMLAAERCGKLDPEDEFHRLLAGTAVTYLEHGSRVDLAAVALHVHPNTVKHRLRRLGELTTFDTPPPAEDTLTHTLAWWWALRTWLGRT
jgi:sugar diacid utilization regulator